MAIDWISYTYSLLVAGGGIMGYMKAGSTTSLGAGLLFGGLSAMGAYRSSTDSQDVFLSLGVTSSLSCLMGFRYYTTGKFMPAGLTAILSIGMVLKCAYALSSNTSQSTKSQ